MSWQYINENRLGICFALCILALLFILVGHVYKDKIQSVLKYELCKFPECSIDYWSISHFMLFGVFGFLIPNYPLSAFAIGARFEFAEDYLASDNNKLFADCSSPCGKDTLCTKQTPRRFWCNGIQDGYWYSNMTDSWVNLTGYVIGSALRTTCFSETFN